MYPRHKLRMSKQINRAYNIGQRDFCSESYYKYQLLMAYTKKEKQKQKVENKTPLLRVP